MQFEEDLDKEYEKYLENPVITANLEKVKEIKKITTKFLKEEPDKITFANTEDNYTSIFLSWYALGHWSDFDVSICIEIVTIDDPTDSVEFDFCVSFFFEKNEKYNVPNYIKEDILGLWPKDKMKFIELFTSFRNFIFNLN